MSQTGHSHTDPPPEFQRTEPDALSVDHDGATDYVPASDNSPDTAPAHRALRQAPHRAGSEPGASLGRDLAYMAGLAAGWPFLAWKLFRKPDSFFKLKEKFGHVNIKPSSPRILIHAVSVGEALAVKPLLDRLKAIGPSDGDILVSVTTKTGMEVAENRYGANHVVRYPLDFSWMIRRFLDRVQPDMVILMELEVWPNFTAECRRRSIPVAVVNGRMTDRSFQIYRRFKRWLTGAFQNLDMILAQDLEIAERFRELGVADKRLSVTGSVKLDNLDFDTNSRAAVDMRKRLKIGNNVPVLLAGSIHPSEDRIIVDAYTKLLDDFPLLRLVVVPRHVPRVPEMVETIRRAGLPTVKKSELDADPDMAVSDEHVIVGDVMGELKDMYRIADVVFIGGTFIDHGGQNFMEPIALGIPVISGPSLYNFKEAAALLKPTGALTVAQTPEELTDIVANRLRNEPESIRAGEAGRTVLKNTQGAVDLTIRELTGLLRRIGWLSGGS